MDTKMNEAQDPELPCNTGMSPGSEKTRKYLKRLAIQRKIIKLIIDPDTAEAARPDEISDHDAENLPEKKLPE